MLYGIVLVIHVIASLVLIAVILMQAGRGGGLSDMMGAGVQQSQKIFGAQTNQFMSKVTSYCAITFLVASIVLGVMTSHRGKSLLQAEPIQPIFDTTTEEVSLPTVIENEAVSVVADEETAAAAETTAAEAEQVQRAAEEIKAAVDEATP